MLTTPLEKFSFDASSLSLSLVQICKYAMHGRNGIGSWSGEAAFIVTGTWFDDSATRMSGKKTNEMGVREDVGGKGPPLSFRWILRYRLFNWVTYTVPDGRVRVHRCRLVRWEYNLSPPSLLMEIEKYGVKITAPRNSTIRISRKPSSTSDGQKQGFCRRWQAPWKFLFV